MSDPLRFFVPPDTLRGDLVVIEGDAHHHLRNVLRVKAGTEIMLLDGRGGFCNTELTSIEAKLSTARVVSRGSKTSQGLTISLLQSLPKGDKFDLVLQKGTELGVSCFQPIITEHAIPNLPPERQAKREQRWQRIVSEAARQCRRYTLPVVAPVKNLDTSISERTDALRLVLWEEGAVPISHALPKEPPGEVHLLIGPEGGFSGKEILNVTGAGFQPVHLGPRILRTETAGLAATPVLQYLYGDWLQAPIDRD